MNNESIIYNTAVSAGIPKQLAALMVAQAKHETGNFTSNFFKKYNNAFGYSYYNGSKWQLPAPGTIADNGSPIAAYESLFNSTMEVVDWIKRRQTQGKFPANLNDITTPEQYATLLKQSGYYGDTVTNYLKGLKRFFDAGLNIVTDAATLPIVGIIVLGGIIYYIATDKT